MTTYSFRQTQRLVSFEAANQQERAADTKNHNVLCIPGIFGPVGCIAGDARIGVNRGGKGFTTSLAELVRMQNGATRSGHTWDRQILTHVRQARDGVVRLHPLVHAIYSGRKITYELTTASGRRIRATVDHRFMMADGGWCALGDLRPGDYLLVEGTRAPVGPRKKPWYRYRRNLRQHPFARNKEGNQDDRQKVLEHRLIAEAHLNGLRLEDYVRQLRGTRPLPAGHVFLDPAEWVVHHKDRNTRNNAIENLEIVKDLEHKQLHGIEGGWRAGATPLTRERVKTIKIHGVEDVYDLTMLDEPNFLANGFVVHNCGKTALAQGVADEFGLPVFNINCGETADATDITGFPLPSEVVRSEKGNFVPWTLNEALHLACAEPCVLFFDDIDKIPSVTEGALIGLFGKREVKGHKLNPKTILIAAGNRVGDDRLARQLSESIRLRLTPIVMTPTLADFKAYARSTGKVHPVVLGYLDYQGPHLHAWREDVLRFPCQRSWTEASALMFATEDQKSLIGGKENDAWNTIVELKCGAHVAADFWAWYCLTRKVDVRKLLTEGDLSMDVEEKDRVMAQYAAIFAVSMELNNRGVKKDYTGLEVFLKKVTPELRVAAITQLQPNVRQQIAKLFPKAGDVLLQDLLRKDDE